MTYTRPAKGHYSESEAAQQLGVSLEEFRALVREHVVQQDEEMENLRLTGIQPADLVLLQLLRATRSAK
jgi:hypothetical protein